VDGYQTYKDNRFLLWPSVLHQRKHISSLGYKKQYITEYKKKAKRNDVQIETLLLEKRKREEEQKRFVESSKIGDE